MTTELDVNVLPKNPKENYEDGVIADHVTALLSLINKGDWGQEDEKGWGCVGRTPLTQLVFVQHQDA